MRNFTKPISMDEFKSYPQVYEAKEAIALLYQILTYMLISVIPAAYLYYFQSLKLSPRMNQIILIALSSFSFIALIGIIRENFVIQMLFLSIPVLFIGLYVGTSSLMISSILALLALVLLQTPVIFIVQSAILFMLSIVLNRFTLKVFDTATDSVKYRLVIRNNIILSCAVILLNIIPIIKLLLIGDWLQGLEMISYVVIQFIAVLAYFIAVNRQKEYMKLTSKFDQLKERTFQELDDWKQLAKDVPMSIISVDRFGTIIYANGNAFTHFSKLNKDADDILALGQQLVHIVSQKANQQLSHSIQQSYLSKKSVNTTEFDGEKYTYYFIIPQHDHLYNDSIKFTILVQDVTEIHTLRNELDRMDRLTLVGKMAAGITHEIRNPMAVIRGFVQLMQEKGTGLQQEYFRIIIDELDRANAIISDFLSLAQNKDAITENHSLNEIIHEIAPLLMADANLRGQTLSFSLASNIPYMKLNDREIKQLLLNLARNGMEAMENNGHLEIYTYKSNKSIYLCIADNGPGIPEELKQKIFEPFYTSKNTGTGLGLALCASIIERHNGEVHILNRDTVGTIFEVVFPIEQQLMTS